MSATGRYQFSQSIPIDGFIFPQSNERYVLIVSTLLLILLIGDIVIRLFPARLTSSSPKAAPQLSPTPQVQVASPPSIPLEETPLEDVQVTQQPHSTNPPRSIPPSPKHVSSSKPELKRRIASNREKQKSRYEELQRASARMGFDVLALDKGCEDGAFVSFCERLLFMNYIWKQQREIKSLRKALDRTGGVARETAFKAFCDRLLLSNTIWKLEKEVDQLVTDEANLKRSQIDGISQMARQVMVDMQKESLVEDLVKDLIEEVEDGKRQLVKLREAHKREVDEIHNEWIKDYRVVIREREKLKLGQRARLVQQEVADELENDVFARLNAAERLLEGPSRRISFAETLVEEETLSEASTTATCISTRARTPLRKAASSGRKCLGGTLSRRISAPELARKRVLSKPAKAAPTWKP
ncbi:hypothetical protein BDN72DRAFT_838289 [Pluteus cervinus]|uniref:Uncharacterized protein n=1 Tax=Pluteus cervinus TaxID=181527 RepID=A0ACD3AZ62_9AGAR|nr:hypothetical protein BDN72DRAFT_838289 [Pluteus cervinus]